MLKKFVSPRKNLSAPLTASLQSAVEQVKADIWAVRASDEHYKRRNALVICRHTELAKISIPDAFKGTDIFWLDWKGEVLTKQRCIEQIVKPLAQGAKIKTVIVFDAELMDAEKLEYMSYCLDTVDPSTAFVFVVMASTVVPFLRRRCEVSLDFKEAGPTEQYVAEAVRYFREMFKQLADMTLSDAFMSEVKLHISTMSPDAVALLLDAFWYQYTEARFAGVYLNTDEFRLSLFQKAMQPKHTNN
jgi:hypothetical protein